MWYVGAIDPILGLCELCGSFACGLREPLTPKMGLQDVCVWFAGAIHPYNRKKVVYKQFRSCTLGQDVFSKTFIYKVCSYIPKLQKIYKNISSQIYG